jgi:hypothetical protein
VLVLPSYNVFVLWDSVVVVRQIIPIVIHLPSFPATAYT